MTTLLVGSNENREELFSSPKFNRFEDGWRRNIDLVFSIHNERTEPCEFESIIEDVSSSDEIGTGKKVLSSSDERFSVLGSHKIVCNTHQNQGFSPCFFRLWKMQNHLISIEISV